MTDTTPRMALPLLVPGQAQKEMFHNEALVRLDLAVQASVVAVGLNDAPDTPESGQAWIVGTAPTGAWSGQAGALAGWTDGGWRFVAALEGMAVWDQATRTVARRVDSAWLTGVVAASRLVIDGTQVVGAQRPAIADPAGGATVDGEARAAVAAILAALRAHGLIAA